jgi:hypothetical protein
MLNSKASFLSHALYHLINDHNLLHIAGIHSSGQLGHIWSDSKCPRNTCWSEVFLCIWVSFSFFSSVLRLKTEPDNYIVPYDVTFWFINTLPRIYCCPSQYFRLRIFKKTKYTKCVISSKEIN